MAVWGACRAVALRRRIRPHRSPHGLLADKWRGTSRTAAVGIPPKRPLYPGLKALARFRVEKATADVADGRRCEGERRIAARHGSVPGTRIVQP